MTKETGSEMLVPVNSGPWPAATSAKMATASIPTCSRTLRRQLRLHHHPQGDSHLNDAILAAAKELSDRPRAAAHHLRHSDGKEYGSKATYKEVLRYLDTNKITVYGTLVGDSARWGEGYISRIHLPSACTTTSSTVHRGHRRHSGLRTRPERIEKSYAKIAEEARTSTPGLRQPRIHLRQQVPQDRCPRRPPGWRSSPPGYYPSAQTPIKQLAQRPKRKACALGTGLSL